MFGQKYKYKIIVLNDKTFLGIYRDKEIIEYKILIKKLEKEYITDKINIFLAGQLKNKLQIFHDTYQKIMKVPEHKINIRKKKNSWATNHVNKKNIYYNFKLVHHDLEKIKYVVAHELAHYFEANHSKKFWEIVEKYEINWKKIRKRLNKGE
ncbi:M48 family metallopeptidase [Mycoplasma iguanae]|uniref:M48 family metallopeptidase n=1 Tax=Mycoplasma iguanae TaxID=292461 RepID=A0ABY5RB06_9MOLU|nr:M48 family metallopeptidase [Mycoplasma iguanae]UVD81954.1 M48 family metallopeptidase [Mycoplasma iguanae]